MRKVLPLLIFVLLAALVLVPGAQAIKYTGGMTASGSPGCHSHCSGGGGIAPWFDIANLDDESITWPSAATLDRYRCLVDKHSSCAPKLSSLSVAKTVTDEIVTRDKTAIWKNNCQDSGATQSANLSKLNPAAVGCKMTFNADTFPYYGEIHYESPDTTSGGQIDETVAWNIQIWREGSAKPIWERRIGLGGGSDADTKGTTNKAWWYGGINKRFSTAAKKAGPLGPLPSSDKALCNARKKTGLRTCYWKISSNENITIHWSLQGGRGTISYTLAARPKLFYAVHIVAVDGREQLMPGSGPAAFLWPKTASVKPNFFEVYMPDILGPCNPEIEDCCTTCTPTTAPPIGTDEPNPSVSLATDSPAPTRVQTDNEATVSSGGLDAWSDAFPWSVRLIHFTPQSRYNGVNGSSYAANYVTYDQNNVSLIAPPSAAGTRAQAKAVLLQQPALITLPPFLDPLGDSSVLSDNNFGISWLRPTLVNPCSQKYQVLNAGWASQQGVWPVKSSQCIYGTNVARDAWDDYLEASTIYESLWASADSKAEPVGWITDSPLRCSEAAYLGQRVLVGGGGTGHTACQANNTFVPYSGSAVDNTGQPIGQTQRVRGFVHPDTDQLADAGKHGAAVGVKIKTNSPSLITDFNIWDRDTLQNADVNGAAFIQRGTPLRVNTVSGAQNTRELWFCTNGIPRTAVYSGKTFNVKLDLLDTSAANDDLRVSDIDPLASVRKPSTALPTSGASPYTSNNPRDYKNWRFDLVDDSLNAADFTPAAKAASAVGPGAPSDGCGGYVVKWAWGAGSGQTGSVGNQADTSGTYTDTGWYTHWGVCGYNMLAPPASAIGGTNKRTTDVNFYTSGYSSSLPGYPNANSTLNGLKANSASWGRYGQFGSWKLPGSASVDFNNASSGTSATQGLLRGTVPYIGKRPGQVGNGGSNSSSFYYDAQCSKTVSGHYHDGSWVHVSDRTKTITTTYPPTCHDPSRRECSVPISVTITVIIPQYAWSWSQNAENCRPEDTSTPGNHPKGSSGAQIFPDSTQISSTQEGRTTYGSTAIPSGGEIAPSNNPWGSGWSCTRQVGNSGVDIPTNNKTGSKATSKADAYAYMQSGEWVLGQSPGDGWGYNQTGAALPVNQDNGLSGYSVQFVFSGISALHADSVNWALTSSYVGSQAAQWWSHWAASDPSDPVNVNAAQTVAVYGTRLTR